MSQQKILGGVIIGFAFLIIAFNTFFIIDQREQAFTIQFGKMQRVFDTPGLKVKIPFVQKVIRFDRRILDFNLPPKEIIAGDQKRIVIDLYTRYRIVDPIRFYRKTTSEEQVRQRLESIVLNSMKRVIGRVQLSELLSENRVKIMDQIHSEVRNTAKEFGILVLDVRIVRADLPKENSEAIFQRMKAQRKQEANLYRAQGEMLGNEITSKADRKRSEIIATAKREAEEIRGIGEARAVDVYAQAFGQDKSFFEFWRSMQAYPKALDGETTTLVLAPDSDFFKHFGKAYAE